MMSVGRGGRRGPRGPCPYPHGRRLAVPQEAACGCGDGIGQGSLSPGVDPACRLASPRCEDCPGQAGRHEEVHRDRFKAELPCPQGTYKPLYWTSKYPSNREMATSSFELEMILEYKEDAQNQWYFLCT